MDQIDAMASELDKLTDDLEMAKKEIGHLRLESLERYQFGSRMDAARCRLLDENKELRWFIDDFRTIANHTAQLLDGWHADGTAWSEWDEIVRKELSKLMRRAEILCDTDLGKGFLAEDQANPTSMQSKING